MAWLWKLSDSWEVNKPRLVSMKVSFGAMLGHVVAQILDGERLKFYMFLIVSPFWVCFLRNASPSFPPANDNYSGASPNRSWPSSTQGVGSPTRRDTAVDLDEL